MNQSMHFYMSGLFPYLFIRKTDRYRYESTIVLRELFDVPPSIANVTYLLVFSFVRLSYSM